MAERVEALDWSRTPLGPMEQWPQSLRTAVDTILKAPVPMVLWWGANLTMIYNDAYAPLLGGKHPEALGRSSREVWRETWARMEPLAEAVLSRGESVSQERDHFVLERNGKPEEAWFTWSYSPVDDGSGAIGGLLNIAYEETARVLAEREQAKDQAEKERLVRELETQRSRLMDVFDQSPSMMAVLRGPHHVFELANERYLELLGHRDVTGRPVREAIPEIEGQGFIELLDRVYASGEPFVGRDVPVVLQREPGQAPEERIVDFMYQPVKDIDGNVSGILVQGVDLTDRKRVEEALRQSEERFRLLADMMPQMVWVTRPDGYHEYYNRRWYEFTGVPEGSTDGDGWNQMFHPGDQERAWSHWRRSLSTGEAYEIEYRLRRHDGQYRWTLGRAMPVHDEQGKITRWFGTCTDIHEQKLQSEELARARQTAEAASAAKSEFLATLSHELRTPLTPVLLTVSLMESSPALPDELREDVANIRQNVELESQLISDLLDLTRIEQGKLELDMQEVNLHLMIRSAIDICQREASAKLKVELGANRHSVQGDSTRLRQVFWNLIGNAVKFTPPEGTITVRSIDAPDGWIRVEVSDTGQGIDPAVLPRLFTAFEQGESRASRPRAGLGLGLAISRKLAEAHGGTITVQSAGRGRGSTFTVELPTVAATPVSAATAAGPEAAAPSRRLSILLVEDHEPTLGVMKKLLRHLGHRVSGVTSVAEATAAARHDRFDLMICDLGLPDGSGLDVMRQLREQVDGKAIALTGYGMESDIAASRDAGFVEHLTKPVDMAALKAAISRVARGQADT